MMRASPVITGGMSSDTPGPAVSLERGGCVAEEFPPLQGANIVAEGDSMASSIALTVNGQAATVIVDDPAMPLLYVLRENLELRGPRFGCGLGQCGACMVLLDGEAVNSCEIKLSAVGRRKIVTLEGLGTPEQPSPVQQAFIDEQAAQCGYCLNGVIISTVALLAKNKNPSVAEIKKALADNLCRCGTHLRMIRAVQRAARNA
jgi:nicotinate dehydrogenase subunit A